MHIRLTEKDMQFVHLTQGYFRRLEPVAVRMSGADVVRLALRELAEKLAQADKRVSKDYRALVLEDAFEQALDKVLPA